MKAEPRNQLLWRIVPGAASAAGEQDFPGSILTTGAPFHHESMPEEAAILLPMSQGPTRLIERLIDKPAGAGQGDVIVGLFLASPFLNIDLESRRLFHAGFRWVTNLPSVGQHDEEFYQQLADVGLGLDRELDYLARFQAAGFRIAVVVSDTRSASAAAGLDPDAMIVLPRVADFAAGFPSLRQRSTAVQTVAETIRSAGWTGVLLGLGESHDAENQGLWPNRLDGLVCRPKPPSQARQI